MIVHHPFAYQVGPLEITGFGVAVLFAFVVAQIISQRELARRGFDPTPIADLIFAAVIGGLVGAKVYYAFLTGDVHTLWSRSGFVFWGGLIGGTVAVLATARVKRLPLMRIVDVGGIAVAAAYSIGRTGCWAVGDDYGRPWSSVLAVQFPHGAPPSTAANLQLQFGVAVPAGTPPDAVLGVYPTQLMEVALGFLMFLILWRLRKHAHAEGWLFGVYMVLAGIERFLIEFLRAKDDRFFGGLTMAQLIALAVILGGVVLLQARREVTARAHGIYAASA
jgi:phosphatidylglycerol:prolipoprotein diacylglycerol transferase